MKKLFKIGQLVKVDLNTEAGPSYARGSVRRIVRKGGIHKREFLARITGIKILMEGNYEAALAIFVPTRQITLYAVRLGYKNKERFFFPSDIKEVDDKVTYYDYDIPYLWKGSPS